MLFKTPCYYDLCSDEGEIDIFPSQHVQQTTMRTIDDLTDHARRLHATFAAAGDIPFTNRGWPATDGAAMHESVQQLELAVRQASTADLKLRLNAHSWDMGKVRVTEVRRGRWQGEDFDMSVWSDTFFFQQVAKTGKVENPTAAQTVTMGAVPAKRSWLVRFRDTERLLEAIFPLRFPKDLKPIQAKMMRATMTPSLPVAIVPVSLTTGDIDNELGIIEAKVKAYLDVMTFEALRSFVAQCLELDMTTQARLERFVDLVYNTALDNVPMQSVYARFCHDYLLHLPRAYKGIDTDEKKNFIRNLLLSKCQRTFERSVNRSIGNEDGTFTAAEIRAMSVMSVAETVGCVDKKEASMKLDQRAVANMSFIGELVKLDLITNRIIHCCVMALLKKLEDPLLLEVELLCTLLKTVGIHLDDDPQQKALMDSHYATISQLVHSTKLWEGGQLKLQELLRYRAKQLAAKAVVARLTEADRAKLFAKAVHGILNRLTAETADDVLAQCLEVQIMTASQLEHFVNVIHFHAIKTVHLQRVYAHLCHKLSAMLPRIVSDDGTNHFTRMILNRCQQQFGAWLEESSDRARETKRLRARRRQSDVTVDQDEQQEDKRQLKRLAIGNIAFISELYTIGYFPPRCMHACIQQVLTEMVHPDEEGIEMLCTTLKTIGKQLDQPKDRASVDVIFKRMTELSRSRILSGRVRRMLEEVIDKRRSNWAPALKWTPMQGLYASEGTEFKHYYL
ncbi:hypothetical protein HK101_011340 [Irineochytrium annulatum]|nr:hypothetical protein HK101_011340 [Irineochytrium annulatum]